MCVVCVCASVEVKLLFDSRTWECTLCTIDSFNNSDETFYQLIWSIFMCVIQWCTAVWTAVASFNFDFHSFPFEISEFPRFRLFRNRFKWSVQFFIFPEKSADNVYLCVRIITNRERNCAMWTRFFFRHETIIIGFPKTFSHTYMILDFTLTRCSYLFAMLCIYVYNYAYMNLTSCEIAKVFLPPFAFFFYCRLSNLSANDIHTTLQRSHSMFKWFRVFFSVFICNC